LRQASQDAVGTSGSSESGAVPMLTLQLQFGSFYVPTNYVSINVTLSRKYQVHITECTACSITRLSTARQGQLGCLVYTKEGNHIAGKGLPNLFKDGYRCNSETDRPHTMNQSNCILSYRRLK
jgi:hypothetical protein